MIAGRPYSLSVKVVISDSQGRCLLVRRSAESKNNAGKWEFPGGKLEAAEAFDEGLMREVREETGLAVTISGVAGAAESMTADHRIAYLILKAECASADVRLSDEHDRYAWVDPSRLAEQDLVPQFNEFARVYSRTHGMVPGGGS